MAEQWQTQRERGNRLALRLLAWIALHIGRRAVFALLCFVVSHYFLVAGKARQASRQFLQRALQREPSWWNIYCHMLTFALVSVDRFYFLSRRESLFDVRVYGNELFASFNGRGCFLLTSHMGSFDALRVMGNGQRERAAAVRVLLDIQHNANALRLIQSLDPVMASRVIDARTAKPALTLMLSEAVADGQMIGIMADRCVEGDRTSALDFLGKPAHFPQGVWQLASLLQVPVVACFGLYKGGNRYDLHFELISEQLGTGRKDRAEAIAAGMLLYSQRLAYFARNNPTNWFNFYDFWQDEST